MQVARPSCTLGPQQFAGFWGAERTAPEPSYHLIAPPIIMMPKIHLHTITRERLKSQIKVYRGFFISRLFPTFDNLESEAEAFAHEEFKRLMSTSSGPDVNESSLGEDALYEGMCHLAALTSVRYSFTAIAIASLYNIWEQQAREFLFSQLQENHLPDPATFCTHGMDDILTNFNQNMVDLKILKSWTSLDELRLVCNVVKHGDGHSAIELLKRNPLYSIHH